MINSILDTDLYKFSVSYAYFNKYPLSDGVFRFTDRNREVWDKSLQQTFLSQFTNELYRASLLKLTDSEFEWCVKNIPYIPQTYWEWLRTFRFDVNDVTYGFDTDGVFYCSSSNKLYKNTLYEILILATYSELRNNTHIIVPKYNTVEKLIDDKIAYANKHDIKFSEFGTRRRFSSNVQNIIISKIKDKSKTCIGTSNVYYAYIYNMKPIGTYPHEWVMFHAACFGYKRANYLSIEDWINIYRGNLGTALIDTYTTKSFLHTLNKQQAILLSGFRQDSGDEIEIGYSIINRLYELGIDPKTKNIIFSNALDFKKAKLINDEFKYKCKTSFGIGTNLTCDVGISDYKPANIVMKLIQCRFSDKDVYERCIKISDDIGKHMGDDNEIEIAKQQLHIINTSN